MSIVERSTLLGLLDPARVTRSAGQILLREGEVSGKMYLLQLGELDVVRTQDDGTEVHVGVVTPGQLVGEVSLLERRPHGATVRARTDCVLLELGRELLDGFDPDDSTPLESLLVEMARSLSAHLRRSSDETLASLRRELEQSRMRTAMASFLLHLLLGFAAYAVVMKVIVSQGVTLKNATVLTGPMMLAMLAVAVAFARRSGLPLRTFGVHREHARRHALEAVWWSVPVMALLTAGKWALVRWVPAFADLSVSPVVQEPFSAGPLLGYLAYAALVPMQEFLARGAIQGSLYAFFVGSERRRWFWAVVVSNTLFGVTHLHLTLAYGTAAYLGGFMWGVLYARQRSLVGPIVSHVLIGVYALYGLGFAELLKTLA